MQKHSVSWNQIESVFNGVVLDRVMDTGRQESTLLVLYKLPIVLTGVSTGDDNGFKLDRDSDSDPAVQ